ncbi:MULTISPECIES: AAA family ATPase [unclassified Mycobacterium]|uniref:AAA family ATPase n=1 Tax=unclassified Mycobacterium TaxID=2642494 RepID=UPI0029C907C4|nr:MULTISPECIES: AAA family ATPase [unclassified Mycobacterium]
MISGDALTGRDTELAELRRALGGVGKYAGVVIAGAAGVGKTRLARELMARAAGAGIQPSWVVGTASARPIPLGAFTTTLSGEAMTAMTEPAPSVRRVIDSLVGGQGKGRHLIGIDDAHLLDGYSAHVVHHLAQTREARLVVTVRSGTAAPDAVTALWKDGLLARLDLDPLSEDASQAMVEDLLGGPIAPRSAKRFWQLTGGNPLYLQQLVRDQVAADRIRKAAGFWIWDGGVAVSQSMTDLVGSQLDRLTPELARVVDMLSQCEPLEADVLADLVGREHLETADRLHLINVERTGGTLMARLAHPLFGELRRAAAGELHLSTVRGELAKRLSADADRDPQATVRRALLVLESDQTSDAELFLEAARHSMRLLDLDLADRFAAAAAALGSVEAVELQAINRFLAGDGEKAEELLRELVERGVDRHRWATIRSANLVWMLGRPAEAAHILTELALGSETDAQRAERFAVEACVDAVFARCGSAEQKARAALSSDELSDLGALLATLAFMMACGALGHTEDLTPVARAGLDRATNSYESAHFRFWAGGVYARACRLTGRIAECLTAAEVLSELAKDAPGLAYANLIFLLGHAQLMRGDLHTAGVMLREALAGVENHGITTGLRPACTFALAEMYAKLGDAEASAVMLAEARRGVQPDFLFMQTGLALATGWSQAAGGSLAEAIETVLGESRMARDREQPTHELACLQAALQWGVTDGSGAIATRARELADELALPLAEAVATHAESLRSASGEGLLTASAAYQAIGDQSTAADAAAQAAVAFMAAQHRGSGLLASATAEQLARDCGGLCTPATRSLGAPTPLTGRQREVAELVAAELTNKDIADRLVMSVRTVEGHVLRACQRIGVTTRAELAAIMRRRDGPTSR